VAASAVLVRESRAPRRPKLDPVGVILVSAALLLLLYPLVQGRQLGWPTWSFVSMAAAAPVFAAFVGYELFKGRRDTSPLVPMGLFRDRGFGAGMAIAIVLFLGIASFGLVLTLFLQTGLGFTPLHAGLTFLPFSAGVLLASGAAARLAPRFGRGVIMTGALIMAGGVVAMIATVNHYGAAVSTWDLTPGLLVAGLGFGAVIAPLSDVVLARVPTQDAGSASGVFNTGLQVGNSIGIAVIGVIFFGLLGTQSAPAATAVAPQLRTGLVAAGVPASYTGPIMTQFDRCLHDRLVATDPTVAPPSCRPAPAQRSLPAAADRVLAQAGAGAVRHDFAASVQRTLVFQAGAFLLSFLLMLALPRGAGRHRPAEEQGVSQDETPPATLVTTAEGE
jgi:MFS family permease